MKKYIVRLSPEEKGILEDVIKKSKGGSQKAMRAQILLKADASGPNWNDEKIAEAYEQNNTLVVVSIFLRSPYSTSLKIHLT